MSSLETGVNSCRKTCDSAGQSKSAELRWLELHKGDAGVNGLSIDASSLEHVTACILSGMCQFSTTGSLIVHA